MWLFYQFQPYQELSDGLEKKLNFIDSVVAANTDKSDQGNDFSDFHFIINQSVIKFSQFFTLIDSIADQRLPGNLDLTGDMILVAANPWILDTLRNTDYREALKRGRFVDDLLEEVIIPSGSPIRIPDSLESHRIVSELRSTRLVLNIPEFKLRLIRNFDTILVAAVRVGRNESVFLEAVGREVDLRTPVGKGKIHRVWRTPKSVNLHTGEVYKVTRRDDNRITKMPPVPSLEPEINGNRNGKMIHATTNPVTLGKAYSHGCVGVSEADMWTIYFNLPVGSEIEFRYDLIGPDTVYRDIYKRGH
ncbi:MAG: L,D-transpeptidase [Cyclobacteriaceae bacterium]